MDNTLTLEKLNESLRQLNVIRLPRIIVTLSLEGGPYAYRSDGEETILLCPDDAREAHKTYPMRLLRILSDTSAEYVGVTSWDGPVPIELPLPTFYSHKVG